MRPSNRNTTLVAVGFFIAVLSFVLVLFLAPRVGHQVYLGDGSTQTFCDQEHHNLVYKSQAGAISVVKDGC